MKLHGDAVLTRLAQSACGQADLGLVQRATRRRHGRGDIAGADRPEQLALFSRVGLDSDRFERRQVLRAGLSGAEHFGRRALELRASRLELGHVGRRCRHRLALGNQVVATVAGFHRNPVAQASKITDIL